MGGVVNAKNEKTTVVCACLFKCSTPVFRVLCTNAIVFGLDFMFNCDLIF